MARWLMIFIGLVYLAAALSYLFEKKWPWAVLALCWGVGNLVLAYLSEK
jgi:hypothetical protein